ncbi:MAG: C4-dicarboxylate ABC transporter [Methylobacter sp.]
MTAAGFILAAISFLIPTVAHALDSVSLGLGSIAGSQWQLQGASIALTGITQSQQQLTLIIDRLSLPKPFGGLSLVKIRCSEFTWQSKELLCKRGRTEIYSKRWHSQASNFSFRISENSSALTLTDWHWAGGIISVHAEERDEQWQVRINAEKLDGNSIQQLLPWCWFELKNGKIDIKLDAAGNHAQVRNVTLTTRINGLTGQSKDGRFAGENVTMAATLSTTNEGSDKWQWQSHIDVGGGSLYADPLYLETAGRNLQLDARGAWDVANQRVNIESGDFRHDQVGELHGNATVLYKSGIDIKLARMALRSDNLRDLSSTYLKPFAEQTALQGMELAGRLTADFSFDWQVLSALTVNFDDLYLKDAAGRGEVQGGTGRVYWSNNPLDSRSSHFSWRQLQLSTVPIGPGELSLLIQSNNIRLLKNALLPVLGGSIAIDRFGWHSKPEQEPEVTFEGQVSNVSLEQLTRALAWTPMSGTISGRIPRVEYRNKTLRLGGELAVKVFDGEVRIGNLAASGLFSALPKFYSDVEVDNLDMDQLTGKFKFGGITGRLSGYVRQLYLENWRPVSFFAWLGTPEDDDSRHRISQKAVQNIASIGGGGAADLLSRSFLRFFETFGYDKLGLGCYLHDGVCQLMGVEARDSGYAIITGGGLPRLEVIGYNTRVDWNVLIERLQRIAEPEQALFE